MSGIIFRKNVDTKKNFFIFSVIIGLEYFFQFNSFFNLIFTQKKTFPTYFRKSLIIIVNLKFDDAIKKKYIVTSAKIIHKFRLTIFPTQNKPKLNINNSKQEEAFHSGQLQCKRPAFESCVTRVMVLHLSSYIPRIMIVFM